MENSSNYRLNSFRKIFSHSLVFCVLFYVGNWIETFIHELGHLISGFLLGANIIEFHMGPLFGHVYVSNLLLGIPSFIYIICGSLSGILFSIIIYTGLKKYLKNHDIDNDKGKNHKNKDVQFWIVLFLFWIIQSGFLNETLYYSIGTLISSIDNLGEDPIIVLVSMQHIGWIENAAESRIPFGLLFLMFYFVAIFFVIKLGKLIWLKFGDTTEMKKFLLIWGMIYSISLIIVPFRFGVFS